MKKLLLTLILTISLSTAAQASQYIGNYFTNKFHYSGCKWVKKMNPKNKVYNKTRQWLIKKGYRPCKVCKP